MIMKTTSTNGFYTKNNIALLGIHNFWISTESYIESVHNEVVSSGLIILRITIVNPYAAELFVFSFHSFQAGILEAISSLK